MTRLFTLLATVGCFALGLALFGAGDAIRQAKDATPGWSDTEPDNSDIGPSLYPDGRRCNWDHELVSLGKTPYSADLGPWYYAEDWDGLRDSPRRGEPVFYQVQIRTPGMCGSMGGYWDWASFRRDFRIQDLPEGFLFKPVKDIVSFDEASSVATLHIGNKRIIWKVPSKPVRFVQVTYPKW